MPARPSARRRLRRMLALSLAVWALCLAGLITMWTVDYHHGCPRFGGTGTVGIQKWDWDELDFSCSYAVGGLLHVDHPSKARWGEVTLLLIGLGIGLRADVLAREIKTQAVKASRRKSREDAARRALGMS